MLSIFYCVTGKEATVPIVWWYQRKVHAFYDLLKLSIKPYFIKELVIFLSDFRLLRLGDTCPVIFEHMHNLHFDWLILNVMYFNNHLPKDASFKFWQYKMNKTSQEYISTSYLFNQKSHINIRLVNCPILYIKTGLVCSGSKTSNQCSKHRGRLLMVISISHIRKLMIRLSL